MPSPCTSAKMPFFLGASAYARPYRDRQRDLPNRPGGGLLPGSATQVAQFIAVCRSGYCAMTLWKSVPCWDSLSLASYDACWRERVLMELDFDKEKGAVMPVSFVRIVRLTVVLCALTAVLAGPARAADLGWIDEVKLGVLSHDNALLGLGHHIEPGADINVEVLFPSPAFL